MSDAVLIVDDEQHILQSLKRLLRPDGYEIHLADCGQAALEILAEKEVAVIICDQRMPGMTGVQVLAGAYKLSRDTVRITLTGYTDLASAQASINEGHVNQFLVKPWDDEHLRLVVADAVRAYHIVQEHRRLEALTSQQKTELEAWNRRLEEQVQERTEELRTQNEHLLQLQSHVEQSLRGTVSVLAGTLEAHSPNLGIHCKRVAQLARQLASLLDLDDEQLRDAEFAAHLHDLGKLSKVLGQANAKGRLSGSAKPRLARHTEIGYTILSKVPGFERIALAVRHQHEKFDGSGYPDGLKRDEIPLASRIIAIADAYDKTVFSSDSPTEVLHETGCIMLKEGRGSRFDPRLVDQLLRYLDEIGTVGDGDVEVELSPRKIRPGMVISRPVNNLDGVLLLKEGTRLTPDLIENIRGLGDVDPLLTSVFVRCNPEGDGPGDGNQTREPPEDVPDGTPAEARPDSQRSTGGSSLQRRGTAAPTPAPSGAIQSAGSPSAKQGKVLVVDDSVFVCNALKRELRSAGIEAVATESGWTALGLIEETRFDAVLIDLMMPAMPGEELVERLGREAPTLPCIILTGNATRERVLTLAGKPNVAGIMVKPWDHHRLISTIMAAITSGKPEPAREPV